MDRWNNYYVFWYAVFFIFLFRQLVESSQLCQSENVNDNQRTVYVFEYGCIILRCRIQNENEPVAISKAGTIFVERLEKVTRTPRFHYNYVNDSAANETVHEFQISNISKGKDEGTWSFIYKEYLSRSIRINVFIRPSQEEPTCEARNKFPVYIFNDLLELNCSIRKSDPQVTLVMDGPCDVTNFHLDTSPRSLQGGKRLGCKAVVTDVINGSLLNCSFQQMYPPESHLSPYHNRCQWGPINIQRELKVTLHTSKHAISEGEPIRFECVANVPDALVTWNLSFMPMEQSSSNPGRSAAEVPLPANYGYNTVNISCRAIYRQIEATTTFVREVSASENSDFNASQKSVSRVYLIALLLFVQSLWC